MKSDVLRNVLWSLRERNSHVFLTSCNIDGLIFREDGTWQYTDTFLWILSPAEGFFSQTSYRVRQRNIPFHGEAMGTKGAKNVSAPVKIFSTERYKMDI